jgi:3-hydroxyacyl-[acyl-carrier-protein] dehydratase
MTEEAKPLDCPHSGPNGETDIDGILAMLPHRYPFLLVDKLLEVVPGERVVGVKNVTINEPFFPGHFPDYPVMPAVLVTEAMAQVAALYVVVTELKGDITGKSVYFLGIDQARFRKPVRPGDMLTLIGKPGRRRGDIWKFQCEARRGDETCAEAELTAMLYDSKDRMK